MLVSTLLKNQGAGRVATISGDAAITSAAALLALRPIEMVVVCALDRKILGVVTDSDVMRRVADCGGDTRACTIPVTEIMTRRVVSCAPEDDLDQVHEMMCDRGLRRIPVTDDQGRFLGLVSLRGAAEQLSDQAGFESRMLEEYFFGVGYQ